MTACGLPPVILAELEALQTAIGDLSESAVLEAARPATSPLHGYFTWDDSIAAEAHRLTQAAALIRRYKVRVITETASGEFREVLVRGFVSASRTGADRPAGTYRPVAGLSEVERRVLLMRMRREVSALQARYAHLAEFWQLIGEMAGDGPAAASG